MSHTLRMVQQQLKTLRMGRLLERVEIRAEQAVASSMTHIEFLETLLADEITARQKSSTDKRMKEARFPFAKSLLDYDFSFQPNLSRSTVMELSTCRFIEERRDLLLLGPPGTGKTHLALALCAEAIRLGLSGLYVSVFDCVGDLLQAEAQLQKNTVLRRYLKPDVLVIDDMGLKSLSRQASELLAYSGNFEPVF